MGDNLKKFGGFYIKGVPANSQQDNNGYVPYQNFFQKRDGPAFNNLSGDYYGTHATNFGQNLSLPPINSNPQKVNPQGAPYGNNPYQEGVNVPDDTQKVAEQPQGSPGAGQGPQPGQQVQNGNIGNGNTQNFAIEGNREGKLQQGQDKGMAITPNANPQGVGGGYFDPLATFASTLYEGVSSGLGAGFGAIGALFGSDKQGDVNTTNQALQQPTNTSDIANQSNTSNSSNESLVLPNQNNNVTQLQPNNNVNRSDYTPHFNNFTNKTYGTTNLTGEAKANLSTQFNSSIPYTLKGTSNVNKTSDVPLEKTNIKDDLKLQNNSIKNDTFEVQPNEEVSHAPKTRLDKKIDYMAGIINNGTLKNIEKSESVNTLFTVLYGSLLQDGYSNHLILEELQYIKNQLEERLPLFPTNHLNALMNDLNKVVKEPEGINPEIVKTYNTYGDAIIEDLNDIIENNKDFRDKNNYPKLNNVLDSASQVMGSVQHTEIIEKVLNFITQRHREDVKREVPSKLIQELLNPQNALHFLTHNATHRPSHAPEPYNKKIGNEKYFNFIKNNNLIGSYGSELNDFANHTLSGDKLAAGNRAIAEDIRDQVKKVGSSYFPKNAEEDIKRASEDLTQKYGKDTKRDLYDVEKPRERSYWENVMGGFGNIIRSLTPIDVLTHLLGGDPSYKEISDRTSRLPEFARKTYDENLKRFQELVPAVLTKYLFDNNEEEYKNKLLPYPKLYTKVLNKLGYFLNGETLEDKLQPNVMDRLVSDLEAANKSSDGLLFFQQELFEEAKKGIEAIHNNRTEGVYNPGDLTLPESKTGITLVQLHDSLYHGLEEYLKRIKTIEKPREVASVLYAGYKAFKGDNTDKQTYTNKYNKLSPKDQNAVDILIHRDPESLLAEEVGDSDENNRHDFSRVNPELEKAISALNKYYSKEKSTNYGYKVNRANVHDTQDLVSKVFDEIKKEKEQKRESLKERNILDIKAREQKEQNEINERQAREKERIARAPSDQKKQSEYYERINAPKEKKKKQSDLEFLGGYAASLLKESNDKITKIKKEEEEERRAEEARQKEEEILLQRHKEMEDQRIKKENNLKSLITGVQNKNKENGLVYNHEQKHGLNKGNMTSGELEDLYNKELALSKKRKARKVLEELLRYNSNMSKPKSQKTLDDLRRLLQKDLIDKPKASILAEWNKNVTEHKKGVVSELIKFDEIEAKKLINEYYYNKIETIKDLFNNTDALNLLEEEEEESYTKGSVRDAMETINNYYERLNTQNEAFNKIYKQALINGTGGTEDNPVYPKYYKTSDVDIEKILDRYTGHLLDKTDLESKNYTATNVNIRQIVDKVLIPEKDKGTSGITYSAKYFTNLANEIAKHHQHEINTWQDKVKKAEEDRKVKMIEKEAKMIEAKKDIKNMEKGYKERKEKNNKITSWEEINAAKENWEYLEELKKEQKEKEEAKRLADIKRKEEQERIQAEEAKRLADIKKEKEANDIKNANLDRYERFIDTFESTIDFMNPSNFDLFQETQYLFPEIQQNIERDLKELTDNLPNTQTAKDVREKFNNLITKFKTVKDKVEQNNALKSENERRVQAKKAALKAARKEIEDLSRQLNKITGGVSKDFDVELPHPWEDTPELLAETKNVLTDRLASAKQLVSSIKKNVRENLNIDLSPIFDAFPLVAFENVLPEDLDKQPLYSSLQKIGNQVKQITEYGLESIDKIKHSSENIEKLAELYTIILSPLSLASTPMETTNPSINSAYNKQVKEIMDLWSMKRFERLVWAAIEKAKRITIIESGELDEFNIRKILNRRVDSMLSTFFQLFRNQDKEKKKFLEKLNSLKKENALI